MGQANMNIMEDASYSFSDVLKDWGYRVLLVLKYWKKLSIAGLFVSILFLTYAYLKPITYSARISFVVEDAKSGGGSLASALSGAFGIDLGGMAGGNSMIAGDNVLELLKSKSLIKKTLLTTINSSNLKDSNSTIADQYAKVNGLYNNWVKDLGRKIEFNKNGGLTEDSLLHIMIEKISEKELSIAKPDKKLSVFELQVTMKDELLCKLFCERLLNMATSFYIETKTERIRKNIARLQERADSLGFLLNKKTYSAAEAASQTLDLNMAYTAPSVSAEISSRDKYMQSTVYAEIVKNLELSKTALAQETPTVQVLDNPELPLKKNKSSKILYLIFGFILGFVGLGAFLFYNTEDSKK